MTDTQLIVVNLWTLFAIMVLATGYVVEYVLNRMEQDFTQPLVKIEQRLYTINAQLCEANRHRETIETRLANVAERL